MEVLHLRNWLYPQQIPRAVDIMTRHLCRDEGNFPCEVVILLAGGQSYRVTNAAGKHCNPDRAVPFAVQIDDAPYRKHTISWL